MRRFGTGILLPALLLLSPHTAGGQSASFKADPQLHAKVTIVDRNPELSAIFDQFERATGLKFTLDEPILAHRPKLGEFQLRDAPVWRVMELIPKIGLVGGSWEKTPGGYRLTAKALAPRKDPTPPK